MYDKSKLSNEFANESPQRAELNLSMITRMLFLTKRTLCRSNSLKCACIIDLCDSEISITSFCI